MKCPVDQAEMEKGIFMNHLWMSGGNEWWGGNSKFLGLPFVGRKKVFVVAYKCPKCGKIELTSDPKE